MQHSAAVHEYLGRTGQKISQELTMKSKIEIKQRNSDGGREQFIYDLPMVFQQYFVTRLH